jgi:hypothetical protein
MTPEERRARIRELTEGLDASEIQELIASLQRDIAEEQSRRAHVAALLRERRSYERGGNEKGVQAVDEQLAYHGHVAEATGTRKR